MRKTAMLTSDQLAAFVTNGIKERGMTRKDVVRAAAQYYPITYDHVREIERGRSKNPSWQVVYALSRVFGFEHTLGFGEIVTDRVTAAPPARDKQVRQIARATRLLMDELQQRKQTASGEQIELWAMEASETFSRSGMKILDADFIRSFLNQQYAENKERN